MNFKHALLILLGCLTFADMPVMAQQAGAPPAPPPFMEVLTPHGTWRHETNLGWYWRPFEADRTSGWRPYLSGGHWEWVGDGWHWRSDYVWGATVFNYGRWFNLAERGGWIWIPGEEFSPAWVYWVKPQDGFWGWAPLPPPASFAPGFLLSPQLTADDFAYVAEGQLANRNLEIVTSIGELPSVSIAPVPSVAAQLTAPVIVQQPSPVVVTPGYYTATTPIVIHEETRYFGPGPLWNYPVCGYCGLRHSGSCRTYRPPPRRPEPPVRIVPTPPPHGYRPPDRGGSRRVVPAPAPAPARPAAPPPRVTPGTTPPSRHPAPAPAVRSPAPAPSMSGRASGIRGALEQRR